MELKFKHKNYEEIRESKVLIVPLWNWNEGPSGVIQPLQGVLIVPLWNWNGVAPDEHGRRLCRF